MSTTCPFCNKALDDQEVECECGAVRQSGLIQKLAGGIAFAITIAAISVVMVLIAAIEPLGKIAYSEENRSTVTQVAIVVGIIAMWELRSLLKRPKWKSNAESSGHQK